LKLVLLESESIAMPRCWPKTRHASHAAISRGLLGEPIFEWTNFMTTLLPNEQWPKP